MTLQGSTKYAHKDSFRSRKACCSIHRLYIETSLHTHHTSVLTGTTTVSFIFMAPIFR